MEDSHNSSNEKIARLRRTCLYNFEILLDQITERQMLIDIASMTLKDPVEFVNACRFMRGRLTQKRCHREDPQQFRIGGRVPRISEIVQRLHSYPIFSFMWYFTCERIEHNFARSTILKALALFVQQM
jgi:hypothetical protein